MENNFELTRSDGQLMTADKINWVTWNEGGSGLEDAHDGPLTGRVLILDMKTMSLDSLQELSARGYSNNTNKSTHSYVTGEIISIEESTNSLVKFNTPEYSYELNINRNPLGNSKSPFSEE
tara:strand:- start:15 stop:377 length:363 start_codon:yes stop_codon:yes gene_type:complete